MESRKGHLVVNQFEIKTEDGIYFQSYSSIIAFKPKGINSFVLDEQYWNYSRTTGKYRNEFLGENTQETKAKIKSGVYILRNLN